MADLNLSLYALLGIIEILLILMMLGGVLFFQLRGSRRDAAMLREQLKQAGSEVRREVVEVEKVVEPAAPQRDYADFLRDELEHSDLLLGENPRGQAEGALDAAPQDDTQALARQMLAARHQFLQLELDVQGIAATADIDAQRQSVIAGMQALLDGLRVHAAAIPEEAVAEAEPASAAGTATRSEVSRLQDQITHLRTVIDNQHDVMRELRQLLEEHGGDSEELQEALRKLGDAEAQAVELHRCLEVMEQENEQLKETAARAATSGVGVSPDAEMLRDLVGSQQRTIGKLQHMLQSLTPDSGKAKELGDAIHKIQRANSELNSCVMVLEDENTMLRGQVESLQVRLADLEAHTTAAPTDTVAEEQGADDIDAMWENAFAEQSSAEDSAAADESPVQATPAAVTPTPANAAGEEAVLDTDDLLAELFGTARDDTDDKKAS